MNMKTWRLRLWLRVLSPNTKARFDRAPWVDRKGSRCLERSHSEFAPTTVISSISAPRDALITALAGFLRESLVTWAVSGLGIIMESCLWLYTYCAAWNSAPEVKACQEELTRKLAQYCEGLQPFSEAAWDKKTAVEQRAILKCMEVEVDRLKLTHDEACREAREWQQAGFFIHDDGSVRFRPGKALCNESGTVRQG